MVVVEWTAYACYLLHKSTTRSVLVTSTHPQFPFSHSLIWRSKMRPITFVGFAAGTYFKNTGGGVNYQCMPSSEPEYNAYSAGGYYARIGGAEYQTHNYGVFPDAAHDQNVPCARCYTDSRSSVMMIPAKRTCPSGWTKEYEGRIKWLITNIGLWVKVYAHNT